MDGLKLELSQRKTLSACMLTSVQILQMTNMQLTDYVRDLMNSNVVVSFSDDQTQMPQKLPSGQAVFDFYDQSERKAVRRQNDADATEKEQLFFDKASEVSALSELRLQISAMKLPQKQQRMLEYLVLCLDENGFLNESDEELAAGTETEPEFIRKCITLLQTLEPAGVGAGNLQECLLLQLQRMPHPDPLAEQIILKYLDALSKKRYPYIAKKLKTTEAEVLRAYQTIRRLNPKPLNGFGDNLYTEYVVPDIRVVQEGDRLRCILNDYFIPKIRIDPYYTDMMKDRSLDSQTKAYLSKCCSQAGEIARHITYRASTLQQVMEYLIEVQADFFRYGFGHRVALQNREIAEHLNLHESTISRAVNGKYFECAWGVFPLKVLLTHSLNATDHIGTVDYDVVIQRIRELIRDEPAEAALSDQKISALLVARGIEISRRTVAKYRQILEIPNANQRNAERRKTVP